MAKILCINPNKWGRGITSIWISSHSGILKRSGHEVALFDATFYKEWTDNEIAYNTQNKQYKPTKYDSMITWSTDIQGAFQQKIDDFQPDVIIGSALSSHIHGEGEYVNIQYSHQLLESVKTSAIKIAGGLQVTADPERIARLYPQYDYFIQGESEIALLEIANLIDSGESFETIRGLVFCSQEKVVINEPREILPSLDILCPYDYSLFENQVFLRPYNGDVLKGIDYELSRGCLFSCSYCVETVIQRYYGFTEVVEETGAIKNFQGYRREKSPQSIYNELKMLHEVHGVTLIRCQDTNFCTIKRSVLSELADLLEANPLPVKLYVETRMDKLSTSDISLLKRLQVDGVGTGLELASEDFRGDFLKRFAEQEKLKENAIRLRDMGIKFTTYNIIGLPEETEDMILSTIELNQELNPDNITCAFYSPYIGTEQANKGTSLAYFDDYEQSADNQLRSVSRGGTKKELLNFYKKYFVHFIRNGLDDLESLKQKEGIK